MLEKYYIKPQTIDHIRANWVAEPIERYVTWLPLGLTTGRGKDDLTHQANRSRKELWVQPLGRNFRQRLCREGHE
jgi:hypothetical protein